MSRTYRFTRYVSEAKAEPFVLKVDDSEVIEIPAPDGDTVLEIEEARSSRRSLELLCGEHYDPPRPTLMLIGHASTPGT